jgi:hypothetical protein
MDTDKTISSELNLLSKSKGALMILPLVMFGYLVCMLTRLEMRWLECIPFMQYMVVPNAWKIKPKCMDFVMNSIPSIQPTSPGFQDCG